MRVLIVLSSVGVAACGSFIEGEDDGSNGTRSSSGASGTSGGTSGTSGGSSGTSGSSSGYTDDPNNGGTRPPPSITSIAPLEGDYGTLVTITGDNLDEASAELVLNGPAEPVKIRMPTGTGTGQPGAIVMKWSKTEIAFKYPFPAEGAVSITTKSGQAQGGSFLPSWRPGSPLSGAFTRRELLSIVSPEAGSMVAAFDGITGPVILHAKDGAVTPRAYDRGAVSVLGLSLYVTPGGAVEGVYSNGGTLYHLTDATGTPATASTGVAALDAAGGYDDSGAYAWIRKGSGELARVRAPSWAESGEIVADPTPSGAPGRSMALSPDHALIVGWGVNSTGSFPFYDHVAYPVTRRMRAGLTTFDSQRTSGSGADDVMLWTRFRAGPEGRVFSYYCANDTGYFSSPSVDCGEGYIDGLGSLGEPKTASHGERISGWSATTTLMASCDTATATLSVGPEGNTAQASSILFPCPKILGLTADPADDVVLLVGVGSYVYSPRKR